MFNIVLLLTIAYVTIYNCPVHTFTHNFIQMKPIQHQKDVKPHLVRSMYSCLKKTADNNEAFLDSTMDSGNVSSSLNMPKPEILYQSEHFIVINKPFDLRMNGDFDYTVEKIIMNYLPMKSNEENEIQLKWIHQLDYATSGVLCIGLTKDGASIASAAFANRETKKSYLALVEGYVDFKLWSSRNQLNSNQDVSKKQNQNEDQNRNTKKARPDNNPLESSSTWQDQIMHKNLQKCYDILVAIKSHHQSSSSNSNALMTDENHIHPLNKDHNHSTFLCTTEATNELFYYTYEQFSEDSKLRKRLRKFLKINGYDVNLDESKADIQNRASSNMNRLDNNDSAHHDYQGIETSIILETDSIMSHETSVISRINSTSICPHLYTLVGPHSSLNEAHQGDAAGIQRTIYYDDDNDRLIVEVSLAEIENEFRVELGHAGNPGKHCTTMMQIIDRGFYKGKPVTKLKLTPITGRRHQLRLHCLCIGHPIVGDETYCKYVQFNEASFNSLCTCPSSPCSIQEKLRIDSPSEDESALAERMMLHAYSLRVPFPKTFIKRKRFKDLFVNSNESTEETVLIDVQTNDPFVNMMDKL